MTMSGVLDVHTGTVTSESLMAYGTTFEKRHQQTQMVRALKFAEMTERPTLSCRGATEMLMGIMPTLRI